MQNSREFPFEIELTAVRLQEYCCWKIDLKENNRLFLTEINVFVKNLALSRTRM